MGDEKYSKKDKCHATGRSECRERDYDIREIMEMYKGKTSEELDAEWEEFKRKFYAKKQIQSY